MRFGIPDIADVDEIRFFGYAKRLGYVSVRVTDTTFLSRERHVVREGHFLTPPEPSDGSSHEVERMDNSRKTSFDDRLSAAAKAKKAELEKFRERSGTNDPALAERQAARHAVSVARDARTAARNASRLAELAREAAEQSARAAAAEAEQAARAAEVARQAADDVALQAERKAGRDARYAARKARTRKR